MIESEKSVRATDIELKDRLVAINRVTKVTKGGRHFSFSAIVVVGDEKSIVGHGLGKANEVTEAISKAVEDAKKNLRRVAVVNDTLPHSIKSKFSCLASSIAFFSSIVPRLLPSLPITWTSSALILSLAFGPWGLLLLWK